MKVDISLAKTIIGSKEHFVVLDNTYYLQVTKEDFYKLQNFLQKKEKKDTKK